MSSEIQKPEQMSLSPEQQAVADLSTVAAELLNAQGVTQQILEDGSQMREVAIAPPFGSKLTEITTTDGIGHYEMTSFFNQSFDRGVITKNWQTGGDSITSTSRMEIEGDTTNVYAQVLDIKRVENDVTYLASELPEKAAKQKGRIGKMLGKLAISR